MAYSQQRLIGCERFPSQASLNWSEVMTVAQITQLGKQTQDTLHLRTGEWKGKGDQEDKKTRSRAVAQHGWGFSRASVLDGYCVALISYLQQKQLGGRGGVPRTGSWLLSRELAQVGGLPLTTSQVLHWNVRLKGTWKKKRMAKRLLVQRILLRESIWRIAPWNKGAWLQFHMAGWLHEKDGPSFINVKRKITT